jgi:c-di-GMP-binding flagellar brake protein YcgR
VYREQRREFVRVPSDLVVRLEYSLDGATKQEDVHSRDISGGGIALYLPRHVILRPGMLVDTKFTLPTGDVPVHVKSVVIRVSDRSDHGIAIGSLQFVDVKESIRQRIIQYTFWRQRTLL